MRLPIAISALLLAAAASSCQDAAAPSRAATTGAPGGTFVDRAGACGLDFVHFNGMTGELYFPETVGSGGAFLDYDADGDLDVYLVQGGMLDDRPLAATTFPPRGADAPPRDRLYRNELVESGELRFRDVTDASGIRSSGYGMGVAAGDYDGDGWTDLYVTRLGPNLMLRNRGDGTFEDTTARTGTTVDTWSSSASFFDHDADGDLDLFVANYVAWSLAAHRPCYSGTSGRDYCSPANYEPHPDRLFDNRGDGTFEDVTARSRIALHYGAGLGVATADFDRDGRLDVYVANDGHANQLWINQGDGTFRDVALLAGCALNENGKAEAGMGVAVADLDEDADEDVFLSHLTDETNTLYLNQGGLVFDDWTVESGLGLPSRPYTGFGTGFLDYDMDGRLDILVANGAVRIIPELSARDDPYPLHQRNQLFRNVGERRFEEVSGQAGPAFELSEVSRAAVFGDVDEDGDVDVLVTNNSGPVRLLINEAAGARPWIGIDLREADGRRDLPGTSVELLFEGRSVWRRTHRDGSYLASGDPRVIVALGRGGPPRAVRAHYPGGAVEEWTGLTAGRYNTLRRGTGRGVAVER